MKTLTQVLKIGILTAAFVGLAVPAAQADTWHATVECKGKGSAVGYGNSAEEAVTDALTKLGEGPYGPGCRITDVG
ncbi:hypothetical protein ACFWF7_15570 [Nocardia sp. NPDC060256]|uniref:hypothetical protein n=1 Tax=unclassified Nocardia TaxID=2637762 RepID=UPI0036508F5B